MLVLFCWHAKKLETKFIKGRRQGTYSWSSCTMSCYLSIRTQIQWTKSFLQAARSGMLLIKKSATSYSVSLDHNWPHRFHKLIKPNTKVPKILCQRLPTPTTVSFVILKFKSYRVLIHHSLIIEPHEIRFCPY